MALLIEIGIRGLIEQKFAQEGAEVNGNKIYHVSEICLRYYFGNSSVAQLV